MSLGSSDCTYGLVSNLESDPMPIEGDPKDLTEIYVTLSGKRYRMMDKARAEVVVVCS